MIRKVEMYQAVCDGCGGKRTPCKSAERALFVASVIRGWNEIDGKLYCPDCVEYDEEIKSYKPKEKKQ